MNGRKGKAMKEMLLDRVGDAPIPAGYRLIDSEVAFLQHATEDDPLLVRGSRLCQWAENFWNGRHIPYRELHSPSETLRQLVPTMTQLQAQAICTQLPDALLAKLYELNLVPLLQAIFPNALWTERPSKNHAATWLLWLYERAPDIIYEPLLAEQTRQWQREVNDVSYDIYAATNVIQACELLYIWLGVKSNPLLAKLDEFPLALPTVLHEQALKEWHNQIVSHHGTLIAELQNRPIRLDLLKAIARKTVTYLEHNPQKLDQTLHDQLTPYLTTTDQEKLWQFAPPPMPNNLPEEPEAVLNWFRHEYLPARRWQTRYGANDDRQRIEGLAKQFTLWYLKQYPRALNGGPVKNYLSFVRSAAIEQEDNYITLLIVLDGLHLPDAEQLLGQLKSETSNRLTVLANELAFAPLPTITEICKPALFAGVPPKLADEMQPLGAIVPDQRSPVDILRHAQPGKLHIWRVADPDATYHRFNSSDNLRQEIEGRLFSIVAKIKEVVVGVPDERLLRLIITSDHGRLLAQATRTLKVPTGMHSHGRAALGKTKRQFDECGFEIEKDVIYLHGGRFGLASDAAMAFTSNTFRTNSNSVGAEWYPHGGAFPEEVIVPWIELIRDMTLPELTVILNGNGQAGKPGELILNWHYPGETPLQIVGLRLFVGQQLKSLPVDIPVAKMSAKQCAIPLDVWLTSNEIKQLSAQIAVRLPNKLVFTIPVEEINLESKEMYHRDNILGDLEL